MACSRAAQGTSDPQLDKVTPTDGMHFEICSYHDVQVRFASEPSRGKTPSDWPSSDTWAARRNPASEVQSRAVAMIFRLLTITAIPPLTSKDTVSC